MQIPHDAVLLRIFIGESDRWHHLPLYEAIQAFLPLLDEMMPGGLVTTERVKVIEYRAAPTGPPGASA